VAIFFALDQKFMRSGHNATALWKSPHPENTSGLRTLLQVSMVAQKKKQWNTVPG